MAQTRAVPPQQTCFSRKILQHQVSQPKTQEPSLTLLLPHTRWPVHQKSLSPRTLPYVLNLSASLPPLITTPVQSSLSVQWPPSFAPWQHDLEKDKSGQIIYLQWFLTAVRKNSKPLTWPAKTLWYVTGSATFSFTYFGGSVRIGSFTLSGTRSLGKHLPEALSCASSYLPWYSRTRKGGQRVVDSVNTCWRKKRPSQHDGSRML